MQTTVLTYCIIIPPVGLVLASTFLQPSVSQQSLYFPFFSAIRLTPETSVSALALKLLEELLLIKELFKATSTWVNFFIYNCDDDLVVGNLLSVSRKWKGKLKFHEFLSLVWLLIKICREESDINLLTFVLDFAINCRCDLDTKLFTFRVFPVWNSDACWNRERFH